MPNAETIRAMEAARNGIGPGRGFTSKYLISYGTIIAHLYHKKQFSIMRQKILIDTLPKVLYSVERRKNVFLSDSHYNLDGGLRMKRKYLSETEYQILDVLWSQSKTIRQTELLEYFNREGKKWERQTLNTLLRRLEEKGFVKRENHIVIPLCSRQEVGAQILEETLENYYEGNIKMMFAALTETGSISEEQKTLLRKTIAEYSEEKEDT